MRKEIKKVKNGRRESASQKVRESEGGRDRERERGIMIKIHKTSESVGRERERGRVRDGGTKGGRDRVEAARWAGDVS